MVTPGPAPIFRSRPTHRDGSYTRAIPSDAFSGFLSPDRSGSPVGPLCVHFVLSWLSAGVPAGTGLVLCDLRVPRSFSAFHGKSCANVVWPNPGTAGNADRFGARITRQDPWFWTPAFFCSGYEVPPSGLSWCTRFLTRRSGHLMLSNILKAELQFRCIFVFPLLANPQVAIYSFHEKTLIHVTFFVSLHRSGHVDDAMCSQLVVSYTLQRCHLDICCPTNRAFASELILSNKMLCTLGVCSI